MLNVTNNQAAMPDTEPVRRGRGRPKKPDALTGAQRQAAYRERQRAASINVTVTKNDNPTSQLQSLRAELSEANRALVQFRLERGQAFAAAASHSRKEALLRIRLARAEAELSDLKTATAGGGDAPGFEVMLKLLAMACERKPVKAQLAIRESDVWRNGVASKSSVSDKQMKRIAAALAGKLT